MFCVFQINILPLPHPDHVTFAASINIQFPDHLASTAATYATATFAISTMLQFTNHASFATATFTTSSTRQFPDHATFTASTFTALTTLQLPDRATFTAATFTALTPLHVLPINPAHREQKWMMIPTHINYCSQK
jgi:hypothetical protein